MRAYACMHGGEKREGKIMEKRRSRGEPGKEQEGLECIWYLWGIFVLLIYTGKYRAELKL